MGGEGSLVMLGGIAGNSYSQGVYDGVVRALEDYPGITLLNEDGPVSTDWEPGKTQQVVAGLITSYGDIDGIVSDYGGGSVGGIRAFQAAGKELPVWTANDSNEFACLWYEHGSEESKYQIATMSSRNWVVQAALNKALAAHNGIVSTDPSIFQLEIIEDSTDPNLMPRAGSAGRRDPLVRPERRAPAGALQLSRPKGVPGSRVLRGGAGHPGEPARLITTM